MRPRRMRLGYIDGGELLDRADLASMRPRRMRLGYRAGAGPGGGRAAASMRPRRMRLGYCSAYNLLFPKAISRCFRAVALS